MDNTTHSNQGSVSALTIEDIRNAVEMLRKAGKQPYMTSIHSRHDLAEIFKIDTLTRNFGMYGGVPVAKNKLIPEGFVRCYLSDGTYKDYPISNEVRFLVAD